MPNRVCLPESAEACTASTNRRGQPAPVLLLKMLCSQCQLSELCPPCKLPNSDGNGGQGSMFARRKVLAGEDLFRQGDAFRFIYAVRCGTLKSTVTLADGREQICGFHLTGEVIALDGIASGAYAATTTALEDTQVCGVAYAPLVDVIGHDSVLQHRLSRLMSREIVRTHRLVMLLGSLNAQERLAAFLLDMSQRFDAHGYSAREFILRMTRAEIGSFLGLTLETVSRTFSVMQDQGLLEVDKRRVRIVNLEHFSHHYESLLQAE
jgi:CRP/FNR family transcriptional regulator, anaerobic regulatory protein